ncbi:MAG: nitroreductase family deazaflavin-dependent oxidoreductase [Acidimicrobiales bacterium]|nr:nitroreductase family deazaflavin-dependent oxidoreductase [Acidimicrobiales bacterium]
MSSIDEMNDWNAKVIAEFRENGGKVGGPFEGAPMVLVHHTGAKTGTERINPLMCRIEGDRVYIFASKAGAPDNPDWYHNLLAHPETTIEIGDESDVAVRVTELAGAERDRVWEQQKAAFPQFADYEANTDRTIPVLALDRV